MPAVRLIEGDCLIEIPKLVADGIVVDSIVCDPPYHLTSGNAVYDLRLTGSGNPRVRRSAQGGGFVGQKWDGGDIAFRPETWRACFDVLKPGGFLLAFGGTRSSHRMICAIEDAGFVIQDKILWLHAQGFPKGRTHLKPAHEDICVAYRPGGKRTLQIDECRVPLAPDDPLQAGISGRDGQPLDPEGGWGFRRVDRPAAVGRYPANVCHSGEPEVMEAFAAFGDRGGGKASGYNWEPSRQDNPTHIARNIKSGVHFGDTGTVARFFFSAKADADDRYGSKHPTVKPIKLIEWLVKLVTPPGGTVLDCFAGSGTTGVAAIAAGRNAILIEREAEYAADIRERLAFYEGDGRHSLSSKARNRTAEPLGGLFAGIDE